MTPAEFAVRLEARREGSAWRAKCGAHEDSHTALMNGGTPVLYHLPEVLAAVLAGKRIWIPEGEKDVEALRALGKVATCNPFGAGKWRPEYSGALRGADVVLVPDKDEPGHAHMKQVA